jgi:arsenite methyltransferase
MSSENIKPIVQEKYGAAAKRAASDQASACCGSSPASTLGGCGSITANLCGEAEAGSVPEAAMRASLGCGNPTTLANLAAGETVLDLGSGGGIDVLLSADASGLREKPTAWT